MKLIYPKGVGQIGRLVSGKALGANSVVFAMSVSVAPLLPIPYLFPKLLARHATIAFSYLVNETTSDHFNTSKLFTLVVL